jgi:hypothetical protein
MKYLSVIIFAVLMSWTWFVINSEDSIPLETHAGIQAKLGSLIEETIHTKKPQATEFSIDSLWTEPVENSHGKKVQAHFSYRFKEPTESGGITQSIIKGVGLLEKQSDDDSDVGKWTLSEVKTTGDSVIFQDAITITTGDSSDKSSEPATSPAAPQKEPGH